jgi:hypothetical protein
MNVVLEAMAEAGLKRCFPDVDKQTAIRHHLQFYIASIDIVRGRSITVGDRALFVTTRGLGGGNTLRLYFEMGDPIRIWNIGVVKNRP